MPETVRYCISCGKEIGDQPFCTNPGCKAVPNFYLHVPGPGPHFSRISCERVPARSGRARPEPEPQAPTRPYDVQRGGDRRTLPLEGAPVAVLRATRPPHEQHPIFPGKTEIGASSPARIVIDRPEVSSRHATIVCRKSTSDQWEVGVADRKSTNGTYVNDKKITTRKLKEGDRVRFANSEFELRFLATEEPRVTIAM